MLSPLLGHQMLHHRLLCLLLEEFANESRIPQFASNAQILTAAHQSVRLAPLRGRGNAIGVKIGLLSTSDRNESIKSQISLGSSVIRAESLST